MLKQTPSRSPGGSVKDYVTVAPPDLNFRVLRGPSQLATTSTPALLLGLQATCRSVECFFSYVCLFHDSSGSHVLSCASPTGQKKTRMTKNRDARKISEPLDDFAGHLVLAVFCGDRPNKRLFHHLLKHVAACSPSGKLTFP